MLAETLKDKTQRVSILRRIKNFTKRMVRRSCHACQARPPQQQITYTWRAKYSPDEAGPSQSVAIARRTRHRGNEEEAGSSHTQPDFQTARTCGRCRGWGQSRRIRRALSCLYNWNTCINLIYDVIYDIGPMKVLYDIIVCIVDLSLCFDMLWTWVYVLEFVNWVLLICVGFEFEYALIYCVYEFVA